MSVLLDELIKERRASAADYANYLLKVKDLCTQVTKPQTSSRYPASLNTGARRALYDNLDKNEVLSILMDEEITYSKKADWRGNKIKERELTNIIRKHLVDEAEVERIFELIKNQSEY